LSETAGCQKYYRQEHCYFSHRYLFMYIIDGKPCQKFNGFFDLH
jgi:hypothetical protein